jgi:hypothetical protein
MGRVSIDTTGYSREPGSPAGAIRINRTAWFVWTAPVGSPSSVRFSTYGSSYDTAINLWKRDPANPTPQVTALLNRDWCAGEPDSWWTTIANLNVGTGYITWTPQAGTTYFISLGRNANGGEELDARGDLWRGDGSGWRNTGDSER